MKNVISTNGTMTLHSVRLHRGDDFLLAIKALAKEKHIKAGVVLSAVGCVLEAKLRDASGVTIRAVKEHCEIVSLNGTVSENRCHLHTTCELVIAELPEQQIDVEFDEETGYKELIFKVKRD